MPPAAYNALQLGPNQFARTSPALGVALDGSAEFTIDAWVRFDALPDSAVILGQPGGFSFRTEGDVLALAIPGFPVVYSDSGRSTLDEDWHYVAATFSPPGEFELYIDGLPNRMEALTGAGTSASTPFQIGADLQGCVRFVRVYDAALGAPLVLANMFDAPTPTPAAWFDFTVSPPVDQGPGKLPITLENGARVVTRTPAAALADTAFVQPVMGEEVNPGGAQIDMYTVQSWIYASPAGSRYQTIFTNGPLDSETGMALSLVWSESAEGFHITAERGSNVDGEILTSTAVVQPNTWANVATTFDGTTATLYLDGEVVGSMPSAPVIAPRLDGDPMIGGTRTEGGAVGQACLQGYVARLDVWERALESGEISGYASTPPPDDAAGLVASWDFSAAPARELLSGHPIGLVDGAELGTQVAEPVSLAEAPAVAEPPAFAPLGDEQLEEIRAGLDLSDVLDEAKDKLDAAAAADVARFAGRPADQELVQAAWDDTLERLRSDPQSARFLVTDHTIDGDRVLLVHTPAGAHVAFRAPADEIDECEFWRIRLIFTLVAGALSVLVAYNAASLTNQVSKVIGAILGDPKVTTALSSIGAEAFGGAAALSLLTDIYATGHLRELVRAMVEVGVWTLIRILVRIVAVALGIGAAEVVAAMAAAAAAVIVVWVQRPSSCDPPPVCQLVGVQFDWDPTNMRGSLPLRKNATTPVASITGPVSGAPPATSPQRGLVQTWSRAAYAMTQVQQNVPAIAASFVIEDLAPRVLNVRAQFGGVLGEIGPLPVSFVDGVGWRYFPLVNNTLLQGGIAVNDTGWLWQFEAEPGVWENMGITQTRVYTLLAIPTLPWWGIGPPGLRSVWTDVLDKACAWAAGQRTAAGAAEAITTSLNALPNAAYPAGGGSVFCPFLGEFNCTALLDRLRTGSPVCVNCTDCATVVTTFANALGADLYAGQMASSEVLPRPAPPPVAFTCNPIIVIGEHEPNWAPPAGGAYSFHEVAVPGTAIGLARPVYDACLKVDTGEYPWRWPGDGHAAGPQAGMTWTLLEVPAPPYAMPFALQSYRERLATNDQSGIGSCFWVGTERVAGGRRVPY